MKRIVIFALLLIALTGCADEVRILSPEASTQYGDPIACVGICTDNDETTITGDTVEMTQDDYKHRYNMALSFLGFFVVCAVVAVLFLAGVL